MYLKVFGLPGEYQIEIDKEAIPRQNYITADLKVKLDILTKNDVIAKVDYSTLWISNMVSVRKPNGTLRVCIDPSILNKMDLEDETENSIKEESDIDNTHVDSVPDGSFPRVERNEDSPSSVFDQCDDNPTDIEHEELDEDCNQENCENIVEFTISTKINKIICDVDVSHYETNQTLEMNNIKPLEEKVYECNVCQKSFERIGSLTKHMQIHINAKPFECDICHKCFTQSSNLKVHIFSAYLLRSNFEMDLVDQTGSAIKEELDLNTKLDYPNVVFDPDRSSPEVEEINERNEDSPSSVFDQCDGNPQKIVYKELDEDYNQESCKPIMDFTISRKVDKIICDVDVNYYESKQALEMQKSKSTDEKAYECNVCQKSFTRIGTLTKHMHTHLNGKPFQCDVCHKSFTLKCNLKGHMRIHTKEKPFECNVCHKCFTQSSNLKSHMRQHTNEKPFQCDICHKRFTQSGHLTSHMRKHTNEKLFECDVCHKCFTQRSNLTTHMHVHDNEKTFECDICKRNFAQNCHLARHMHKHIPEKSLECNVCRKSFTRISNLNRHLRIHLDDKPFVCDICHQSFSQNGNLTRHMRIHTNEKPFECDICHKCFTGKSNLKEHMRVHTNEKPFKCDVCLKCFSRSDTLKDHKRTHTKEKPFECGVCYKCFTQRGNLIKHMHLHTKLIL
ncbi:Zinc finger protein 836 [Nymphon striatum]|nr:Zinc finger protein 836 [Nymphon striatum]